MAYAEKTDVAVEKTVAEIVTMIRRADGDQIAQLDGKDRFVIAFTMADRQVRFVVQFAAPTDDAFAFTRTNQHASSTVRRSPDAAFKAWDQHSRQRMRALMLVIKAKLESVASSVETFEQAFLANVVMSDGATLYDRVKAPIALEYSTGAPQLMLEGPR